MSKKNADDKRIKIIETAKRRFAHYGMGKTTMSEIAKDLSFSKALLYYYFPDKNSLYAAVLESVVEESQQHIEVAIEQTKTIKEAVYSVLDISMDFKKKYYNIMEYTLMIRKELSKEMDNFVCNFFEQQQSLFKTILDRSIKSGEIVQKIDTNEIAKVLFYAIIGMSSSSIKDLKSDFIPNKAEFDTILSLQKKLADIFLKGLVS